MVSVEDDPASAADLGEFLLAELDGSLILVQFDCGLHEDLPLMMDAVAAFP